MLNRINKSPELSPRVSELTRLLQGLPDSRALANLVLLNIFVTFIRPQDLLGALGAIRLPLLIATIPALMWFSHVKKTWTRETRAMLAFLLFHAVYIFVGKVIYDPLVRNDFWAAQVWRDLLQLFLGMIFPLVATMASARQLERVIRVFTLCGVLLSVYALTHSGRGPGGFLGDENDLCLALVMFIAFPFIMLEVRGGNRLWTFGALGAMLGGIVATQSRGGFIGLVCVLAYVFKRSRKKVLLLVMGAVLATGAALLAPQKYWDEVRSIREVKSGTAKSRLDIWAVALKVWLDPRHIVQGVGLENVRHWLGDYEPAVNKTDAGTSIAGRAVHSMYMQLLADLGIIGIVFFSIFVGGSFRRNQRGVKNMQRYLERLRSLQRISEKQLGVELKDKTSADLVVRSAAFVPKVRRELELVISLGSALNVAFVAVLASGSFISVLYYPPLWLLVGMSAAYQKYLQRFENSFVPFAEDLARSLAERRANVARLR